MARHAGDFSWQTRTNHLPGLRRIRPVIRNLRNCTASCSPKCGVPSPIRMRSLLRWRPPSGWPPRPMLNRRSKIRHRIFRLVPPPASAWSVVTGTAEKTSSAGCVEWQLPARQQSEAEPSQKKSGDRVRLPCIRIHFSIQSPNPCRTHFPQSGNHLRRIPRDQKRTTTIITITTIIFQERRTESFLELRAIRRASWKEFVPLRLCVVK